MRSMAWVAVIVVPLAAGHARAGDAPDYTRDVRPILADHCFACHGPDGAGRQAGLRLDEQGAATMPRGGAPAAIVPGDPEGSLLVARIVAHGDERMPPDEFGKPLSDDERAVLTRWVAAGAPFAAHWAFEPPRAPPVPTVRRTDWPRSDLDRFVLARLEAEGLEPAPEADRSMWLRRVSLDLTGLPPSIEEIDAFLADVDPGAHERVVDRLLASPRHAERMAMQWLDVARYADTNGYNNDETRTLWPWRDWVIGAFAANMPFDRFVVEQIAGDLLPGATVAQKVATGFCRNHVLTTEGGIVEEEYRVEYVADRVHTAATAFLGLSLQCARCHDHKFDPFTQVDYYRFAAFFDNVPDTVVGYSQGKMAEPLLEVPSPEQTAERERLAARGAELDRLLAERAATIDDAVAAWEAALDPAARAIDEPAGLVAHFPCDDAPGAAVTSAVGRVAPGTVSGSLGTREGRIGGALVFDGAAHVEAGQAGDFEADAPFTLAAWVFPTSREPSTVLSKIDEADAFRGWDLILEEGKVACHVVHRWPDSAFKVITKEPLALDAWHHVAVVYDGSRRASGARVYVDGVARDTVATTDHVVDGSIRTSQPLRLGKRSVQAPFRGAIDEVRLHDRDLAPGEVAALAAGETPAMLAGILRVPPAERSEGQRARLRRHVVDVVDGPSREWRAEAEGIPARLAAIAKEVPVTMVMGEMAPRRQTRLLVRGRYDQPGEAVGPGVPGIGPLDAEATDRLGLARWLTRPDHPLTARVAVNRWWEMLFGTGITETVEDFGIQGAAPSHPELLDWLATELVRRGWNVRSILREIVLSATYRQTAHAPPSLHERDPRNRLLARGPRGRLPAETLRDNALAIGGLLAERIGGPSVRPWQPEGLWEDVSVERRETYVPDSGEGRHRRSMYTFWKRTCPPPAMTTFDAPDRETCVARRGRTNTPLQALVLLNDPSFVEAAGGLARIVAAARDEDARIVLAWRRALGRSPLPDESAHLRRVLAAAREHFAAEPGAIDNLLAVGALPVPDGVDRGDLAAWTVAASVVLNLDETISTP